MTMPDEWYAKQIAEIAAEAQAKGIGNMPRLEGQPGSPTPEWMNQAVTDAMGKLEALAAKKREADPSKIFTHDKQPTGAPVPAPDPEAPAREALGREISESIAQEHGDPASRRAALEEAQQRTLGEYQRALKRLNDGAARKEAQERATASKQPTLASRAAKAAPAASQGAETALGDVLTKLTKAYAEYMKSRGLAPTGTGHMTHLAENLVRTELRKLGWRYGKRAQGVADVTEWGVKDINGKVHPCTDMHHALDVVRQSTPDGEDPPLVIVRRHTTDWEPPS
jgi:hypothetical protein